MALMNYYPEKETRRGLRNELKIIQRKKENPEGLGDEGKVLLDGKRKVRLYETETREGAKATL